MKEREIQDVPFEEVYELEKYGTHYSDSRLWEKLFRVAKKAGATVVRPVLELYYLLQSGQVSLQHKAYIIGALGYFILPVDLIPDYLLALLGFADDIAVMTFALKTVKENITPEIREQVEKKLDELLHTQHL